MALFVGQKGIAIDRSGLGVDGFNPLNKRFRSAGEKFLMSILNAGQKLAEGV